MPISNKTTFISDHTVDFKALSKKADEIIKRSTLDLKFKAIHYDDFYNSVSSVSISMIILIVVLIILFTYLYKSFFSQEMWNNLADKFENAQIYLPKSIDTKNLSKNTNGIQKITSRIDLPKMGQSEFGIDVHILFLICNRCKVFLRFY